MTQKQGLENLRSLILEAKAGTFDPSSYAQVGPRLAAIGNSNLPFLSDNSMTDYQSGGGSPESGSYGPTAQYSLPPVPNLRTKAELLDAEQIFQAMQSTSYDNPAAITASGVGQLTAAMHRGSHSPPGLQLPSAAHGYPSGLERGSPHSQHSGTPPSSAHSFKSGNSPSSMHGHHGFGGNAPPAAMYPTLPGTSGDPSAGYANMVPASTMGTGLDNGHRRRYSGGRLMKAQPMSNAPKAEDAMDTVEDGATNKKGAAPAKSEVTNGTFSASNLDPALGGTAPSPSGEVTEAAMKDNDLWLGNARTVDGIRNWIKQRLEKMGDENGEDEEAGSESKEEQQASLYPVLVEA